MSKNNLSAKELIDYERMLALMDKHQDYIRRFAARISLAAAGALVLSTSLFFSFEIGDMSVWYRLMWFLGWVLYVGALVAGEFLALNISHRSSFGDESTVSIRVRVDGAPKDKAEDAYKEHKKNLGEADKDADKSLGIAVVAFGFGVIIQLAVIQQALQ